MKYLHIYPLKFHFQCNGLFFFFTSFSLPTIKQGLLYTDNVPNIFVINCMCFLFYYYNLLITKDIYEIFPISMLEYTYLE